MLNPDVIETKVPHYAENVALVDVKHPIESVPPAKIQGFIKRTFI